MMEWLKSCGIDLDIECHAKMQIRTLGSCSDKGGGLSSDIGPGLTRLNQRKPLWPSGIQQNNI